MKPQRVLVLPDTQIYADSKGRTKGIDLDTWYPVLKYIKRYKGHWDQVVQLGDFLDFNCISSHNDENLRAIEGQRIKKDYAAGGLILDQLREAVGDDCQITLIEGNHEHRMERLIDKIPALEGWMEVEKGLRLEERGINYVKSWSEGTMYEIGHAGFIHGGSTTNFHAKKMAGEYLTNIFYGHTHDIQEFSWQTKGHDKTIVGSSLGCLCVYDLPYMRSRPSKWQQAVTTFFFHSDGFFQHYVSRIFKHQFYGPDGLLYK